MATTRLGFLRSSDEIRSGICIPKYYDPSIADSLDQLRSSHNLVTLGSLVDAGKVTVHLGHDIGKHYYGLGNIPYVRTSDLATWEVVSAPKQTVGMDAYEKYAARQDVRAGDVFFVRDGLYLIGRTALVTDQDLPLIHQSHLIRFRPSADAGISSALLLAVLSTPIVLRQVRTKQFTAGIIDKIEDRYRELVLPFPAGESRAAEIGFRVAEIVKRRVELREVLKRIPLFAQGLITDLDSDDIEQNTQLGDDHLGHLLPSGTITSNVLIPKYYDPVITAGLKDLSEKFELRRIDDLVADGILTIETGIEVGKLAYGLGEVPFIRTSDIADWELAGQAKQRVSQELFESLRSKVDVRAGDILLVRDGTYLVGTSAILTESDASALYAGGLYKIRVNKPELLDPYLLLSLLNMPIVKQQIRARQFTRDIIDTLGRRLFEMVIPIPKAKSARDFITDSARDVVEGRARLRDIAKSIVLDIEGASADVADDPEIAAALPI